MIFKFEFLTYGRILLDRKSKMPNFKDDPLKKILENKVIDLSGKQPDSRHVGIIICALVCELSELSAIVSNRLLNMVTDKVRVAKNTKNNRSAFPENFATLIKGGLQKSWSTAK